MTGTIGDAFSASATPAGHRATLDSTSVATSVAETGIAQCLLEQAKGVLIFRYSIDADAALALVELWAAQSGAGVAAVAHALVQDICQGDCGSDHDAWLVRWLEDRLRHECPAEVIGQG